MNDPIIQWVSYVLETFPVSGNLLEIGSWDLNGNCNDAFSDHKRFPSHTRIDLIEGRNVDMVMDAHEMTFASESFDTIACLDMLEHDTRPWWTMDECFRVLKPDGFIIATTVSFNFERHMQPCDFWRFSLDGMRVLMEYARLVPLDIRETDTNQVFAVATKRAEKKNRWFHLRGQ